MSKINYEKLTFSDQASIIKYKHREEFCGVGTDKDSPLISRYDWREIFRVGTELEPSGLLLVVTSGDCG